MSFMTVLMIGFVILIAAGLMIVVHFMRSNHRRLHGASAYGTRGLTSVIHWTIQMLLRIGIPLTILGPMMLLTVRGRKTGLPRTIAVDLHEQDGRRFLIATHGEGNWVHNLRAAGDGILSLGRSRQAFTARELTPEVAGPVIKDVLEPLLVSQGVRGSVLRQHLGVTANSSANEFVDVARSHPVFEVGFCDGVSS